MKQSIGFIGGGRVTRILLQAFRNRNVTFSRIIVADINPEVSANLKNSFNGIQIDDTTTAAAQDIVVISLHPPVVIDTLELVKDQLKPGSTVISLAPKITIAKLSSKLSTTQNIVRLIPNATSFINEGYNPVCFSPDITENAKQELFALLKQLGNTFEVSEEKLESYAIMSAMLPTYFWFQLKALYEIGQKIGLDEKESEESIHETMKASLNLLYKSGLTAKEVMDLIPVKPIGEHEAEITGFYNTKLMGLFEKLKP